MKRTELILLSIAGCMFIYAAALLLGLGEPITNPSFRTLFNGVGKAFIAMTIGAGLIIYVKHN